MSTTGHEGEAVRISGLKKTIRKTLNRGVGSKGTCTTASATAAKEVTLGTTFRLTEGAMAVIRFTYGISAENATLAVTYTDGDGQSQTTEAKPIYYRGAALPAGLVHAKDTLLLKYNGSQWDVVGSIDKSSVSYNSSTGKLQQTINGQTSDVTTIVTSGFSLTEDDTNGLDIIAPIGSATITDDNTNGLDILTF